MDLFWLYLGQHLGSNGGLGLWKELARRMDATQQKVQDSEATVQPRPPQ
jgi:hypothetical protein